MSDIDELKAQARRFEEMVYALDAGNLERADIPADVLARWIKYVQTGKVDEHKDIADSPFAWYAFETDFEEER